MTKPGRNKDIPIFTKRPRLVLFASLMIGALLGSTLAYVATKRNYENLLARVHPIFVQTAPYRLLHPLIGFSLPKDNSNTELPDIRNAMNTFLSEQPHDVLFRHAVYLRDLTSGDWTGINENEPFDPASLMKVVVAIAAERQGEYDTRYMSTPLIYTQDIAVLNAQLSFAQPTSLRVGEAYAVHDLIKRELVDSDNGAVNLLLSSLDDQHLAEIYDELSIPRPDTSGGKNYKLTALEYSRFFRILYYGTLNVDWRDAEEILEHLSRSTFVSGLVAGLPPDITVAHKYGEHVSGTSGVVDRVEMSDCGIVYYTPRPYFLCVMTEGKDPIALSSIIAQVSRIAYAKISEGK